MFVSIWVIRARAKQNESSQNDKDVLSALFPSSFLGKWKRTFTNCELRTSHSLIYRHHFQFRELYLDGFFRFFLSSPRSFISSSVWAVSSIQKWQPTISGKRRRNVKCPKNKPIDTSHLGFTGHIFETLGTELVLFSVIFDAISLLNFISLFSRLPSFVSVFLFSTIHYSHLRFVESPGLYHTVLYKNSEA